MLGVAKCLCFTGSSSFECILQVLGCARAYALLCVLFVLGKVFEFPCGTSFPCFLCFVVIKFSELTKKKLYIYIYTLEYFLLFDRISGTPKFVGKEQFFTDCLFMEYPYRLY